MQIKTDLIDIDLKNFSKNFNLLNNNKISLKILKEKLAKDYHLFLIYNNDKSIIGSCLYKIEINFYDQKICEIIDLFFIDNNDLIIDKAIDYLIKLKHKKFFDIIIYKCMTNNRIIQKKLSKHKFVINSYLFLYN